MGSLADHARTVFILRVSEVSRLTPIYLHWRYPIVRICSAFAYFPRNPYDHERACNVVRVSGCSSPKYLFCSSINSSWICAASLCLPGYTTSEIRRAHPIPNADNDWSERLSLFLESRNCSRSDVYLSTYIYLPYQPCSIAFPHN